MITVTHFDQSEFVLNADLIEFVESKPDTYITLVTGKRLLVRETSAQVVARVVEFRRLAGIFPRHRWPDSGPGKKPPKTPNACEDAAGETT